MASRADGTGKKAYGSPNPHVYLALYLVMYNRITIRSSDNDSTGLWPPGSLHTLGQCRWAHLTKRSAFYVD